MSWIAAAIIAGITSFVATNIDDLVISMLFFAQVNSTFRPRHIFIGKYLGFAALIAASLPGFFGGLIVPKAWIGLLGLVPIAIGISHLVKRENEEKDVQAVSGEFNRQSNSSAVSKLANFFNPQTLNVAAVTVANGGDNIGIYLPLFASSDLPSLVVILAVFFLMVGAWCYVAYWLTSQKAIAQILTRYTKAVVPFVLIGLGIFILIDSGTYRLLPLFQSK
ncbi:MAG: cadmium resistance transporter [Microcoleus sp. PH2017_10_PVI_O_A]|uniref:cadmium resistance transporter n=1 Tax=unclassified Microcoleus TaxID=2642155 RepID=UPI001DDC2CD1|nr:MULTISPECIES: cadmium resistance transporter [unclassified Microcoleus]TAE80388.1 MAG: transporter [Oscillatoriales cyanobacterium]MCC3407066.1 cadmium resistance transporter [Microcoleus sp. PH2017_10_PVI_O_A]MCC3461832.1 cadmium resistance transporter [Microcoleus sp. PH2017_11_PCY_U_A]MCC3477967.1 cadmium resistance transporter [Microcoleus sp. PH2017_12_PCY_D_A]MCC3529075.1 cadmium resistance transporter [Microcoleus sp. PH2017_21_RUC_O_A]